MALSEEQRAMLQLLLERGQSYEDIGSLLGLGVDAVRGRARAALTEIGGQDPDAEVGLTDYLLGQADPIGRADAARHLQSSPDAHALAEKLQAQLRLLAPAAELPDLPAARQSRSASRPSHPAPVPAAEGGPAATAARTGSSGLSGRQKRLIGALLGGAALVALIVLLATGAFSGDDESGGGGAATEEQTTTNAATGENEALTKADLTAVDGSDAVGVAIFQRVRSGQNDVPVINVAARGLEPSAENETYVVWLTGPNDSAFPVSQAPVRQNGLLRGIVPLQPQLLQGLGNGFDSITVTRAPQQRILSELRKAGRARQFPDLIGDVVLRGEIQGPAVQAAQRSGGGGQQQGGG